MESQSKKGLDFFQQDHNGWFVISFPSNIQVTLPREYSFSKGVHFDCNRNSQAVVFKN